jgi:hypothetical protein
MLVDTKPTPASQCATCGIKFDRVSSTDSEATKEPKENDFTLCFRCGTPHRFNADLTLREATDADMEALDADSVARIDKARSAVREIGHSRTAEMTLEVTRKFKGMGWDPKFTLPPAEIVFIASLAQIGPRLARNVQARRLLAELAAESKRQYLLGPTVLMLRVALEMLDIPYEVVSLSELGLQVGTS